MHIFLLLLLFYVYNITTINQADDVNVPMDEAPIVIENEPQIVPDQTQEEIAAEEIITDEITNGDVQNIEETSSGEVFPGIEETTSLAEESLSGSEENMVGNDAMLSGTGEPLSTTSGEILSGVLSEESTISIGTTHTGTNVISGDEELFSGVLASLSGEILYDISGDVVGEVHIESGEIVPVDLSGASLLPQPLSVIYPEKNPILNVSGYIFLDDLLSVTTTGGEWGANYCSRIAYENLSSILKAGVWTRRETNDYILQGDAEDLVIQGLENDILFEVTSGDMKNIFSGTNGTVYGFVYDVYVSFMNVETRTYHRITVVYGDESAASDGAGGQRYVLDPLRGARTTAPQKFEDYIAYYDDEIDVQWYIGQAYIPSVIMEKFFVADDIRQLLSNVIEVLHGVDGLEEQVDGDGDTTLTGEEVLTGNMMTTTTGEILTGEIDEEVTNNEGFSDNISDNVSDNISDNVSDISEETVTENYFTKAYERGDYSEKIIQLQKMLTWMQIYNGILDGVYSDSVIESIYQYQLIKNVLTEDDSVGLRGYLGPKTRIALNQSYVEYQEYDNTFIQQTTEQNISTGTISSNEYISTETGINEVVVPISGQETLHEIGTISGLNLSDMFNPFLTIPTLSGLDSRLSECENDDMVCKKRITQKLLTEKGYTLSDKGLVQLSQDALIGSDNLDMDPLDGEFATEIVMQSANELSGKIAEVQIPENTMIMNEYDGVFTGELSVPIFLDTEVLNTQREDEVIALVDVGADQQLNFEDGSGNKIFATFRVPAPGMNLGDTIDVYYSQDGENRNYLTDVQVQLIDGEPYAIFEADHFTQFYLGDTTGSFVINNDAAYTTGLAVTLNSNVTGATHMRFGNTIAERDLASWVSYATGYAWNFTGLYSGEVKWVYAQFSGNDVVRNVSDSIVYDINSGVNTSGLQLHLNASTGGLRFYDIGYRNLVFTGMAGAYKSTWSGEEIMVTDGVNDYIEGTSGFVTNYPFTISAWVKPNRVNVIQSLVMFGNSATNTTLYGIRLDASGKPNAVAQNTTARSAVSTTTLVAGRWYHIIGVFNSSTSRTIYVDNNNPVTNTSTATFSATNQRRRIGRHPGLSTTNYYSGAIDEVRVYNRSLTTGERQAIFMVPPSFDAQTAFTGTPTLYGSLGDKMYLPTLVISGITYSTTGDGTGKWKTLPMITGLANGTYNVTLNYTNVYGKTGTTIYTGGLVINSTGIYVTYSPSLATTGSVVATLTGLDPSYMIVNNSGSEVYTFTQNGSFTWEYVDKQGTTGSTTATVDWIKDIILSYSTGIFYENNLLNDGSIGSTIRVVLSSGSFTANATGYITLSNVPAGLTGVFTLSGTNTIIISLSGSATNHASVDSTGIVINFLTGAFTEYTPSQIANSENIELFVQFVDAPDYLPGQQLRINGYLSGGQFYDRSPNHRSTTGTDVTTATQSGETYMSFNNATSYIDIGSYTLPNYTISVRFRLNSFGTYDTIIGNGNSSVTTYELIDIYQNKVTFYAHSQLQSTLTIQTGEWYHVALVQGSTGTNMYINGVLDASTATRVELANAALAVGTDLYYTTQARDGGIDEVKIYDSALTTAQVQNLYIIPPSFTPRSTKIASPDLRGLVYDTQMDISLTISGTTYSATNNQDGTRTAWGVGPFSGGTYNVQLNYTNIYGKTGIVFYTGGLIVDPQIHIDYDPSMSTSGSVIATVTGYDAGTFITNNGGSPNYTFTSNGSFTFELENASGDTATITAIVDWIQKATLSYIGTGWREALINNGTVTGSVIATLSTGSFDGAVANYITLGNLPAGLTGAYTLSGTNTVIISLTGIATNHAAANNISDITITFLSGAFVEFNTNDVGGYYKTGLLVSFNDPDPSGGISPSADTTLDADNEESHGCGAGVCQEYNYGALTYGGISDFGSKMLIKFSMASIPAGATITSATLKLTKLSLGGIPTDNGTGFKLRKIINNSGWIEGTKSATAASAGEPNYKQREWTQADWYNGDPGLVQGLDYESSDLLAIGGFTGAAQAQYTQTMPLSVAGVVTLQDWLDNPDTNQGFALVDANQNWIYIASKERATIGERPLLTVSYIVDATAPVINTFTPTDNSSGVVLDTDLNIIFNEYVTAVSGKNIIIKKSVDDSVVETINAANSSLVSFSNGNKTITINPTNLLGSNTGYYVQIESGAFIDRANNAFIGITDTTTWNFTTLDADSVPTVDIPSISGLEYTHVWLGGTVTATGSSAIQELGVVRSTSPGFDIASANKLSQTGNRNDPGTFSLNIAGFNSGSTIYFRAFAANAQGTGYTSETGFILKPDTVQFGTASMISNDTFMVNWFAVTGAAYYELYISTGAACTSYISGYGPVITTGTSKRIMNLEKETTYYYKAIAVNSGGTGPVSVIKTIATSFLPRPRVWLKFEESAGTIAYDSSENFNHGVVYGTPLMQQTGAENKAYYFDGSDDFVAVTDFNMEPDLTVSFRFKKNTTGNNEHVFSRGNDADVNSINVLFDDATQSLRTYINGSQTILNVTGALYTGLLDNQRHFYSLTIADDESVSGKKLCTVFLDGITKLTDSSLNSGEFNPTPNINVGRRSITSAGTYYKGSVDDVRVYGKILTPPEINNLYLMFKDVTKPTATIEYIPSTLTSGNVVAILTGLSETGVTITNNGGLTGYTFTGNGTFTFTFRDEGFNTGEAIATVTWIDKIKPTATIEYVPSLATTGSVIATLTGFSETGVTITNNGGLSGYTFTNNGSFTFEFIDLAGNTGETTATVDYIKTSALSYNTLTLFEDISTNDGQLTGAITITLSTGSFTGVVSQYLQINNLPEGLTGDVVLSGTNKVIVTISGHASNHNTGDSVSNISFEFLTGAFVDMDPYEILNVVQTGIAIVFYAPNPETGIVPTDDTMANANTDANTPSGMDCSDGSCQRNNYGARSFLTVSQEGSKTLLRFNISDVPAGFTINSAKLRLTRYNATGVTYATGFELRQLINNDDWIEGTKLATEASAGEPNFYQRKRLQEDWFGGGPGLKPGYDYAATNLLSASYFTGSNTGTYTQEFFFNLTGIQALNTSAAGADYISFVLTDPNEQYLSIYSKEATNADYRPLLTFSYYADYVAPTIASLVPINASTGVSLDSNMFIEFTEAVTPVTGKNIYLRKIDGTLIETISVTDTNKIYIIDPNTIVLINPTGSLENNTGYYIEIDSGAFQDIAGNGFAGFTGSATWSFVTADMTGRPTLTGVYYSGVTTTTAILGGTILTTGASNIIERGIYWSTIEGFYGYIHGNKVSETGTWNDTGFFSLPVTDLPAGTRIYFEAFANNDQGHGHTSIGSFMTLPPQPILLQETDVDYDTMTLNWISTGADTHMVYVSTGADFASYISGYGPHVGITGDSYILNGLSTDTTYYYKIVAVNTAGNSQESEVGSGTTTSYPIPTCWLKMDELSGTNAYDSSPYFHNGIILGSPVMNQSGIDGGAYCLDGINDQVSVVDFDYGSSYTIGFWFKSTGTGDNMHIFSHGGDNDPASLNVILDSTTQTLTTRYNGDALAVFGSDLYNEVTDGYRHYYVFAVDNGNSINPGFKTVAIRVDGIDYYTNSNLPLSSSGSVNNIMMGRSSVAMTGYFKGCIDDLRIRNLGFFTANLSFLNASIMYFYNVIGDHSVPTATPIYVPDSLTSGDVVATLTGYSNGLLILNNSGSNEYTFTGNGSFDFLAVNAAGNSVGNTGNITATVTWIDKIKPTATIEYIPSEWTNGDVVAILTGLSETITGWNETGYIFTDNGTFVFTFADLAGNTGEVTATVDRIDVIKPTATIEYAPVSGTRTSGDVVATLTGFNKTGITITNNSGLTGYTFTGNGTFTFTFMDLAGNTGETTATVDWIDKIAPEIILLTPASGTTIVTGTLFSRSGSDNVMISGYIFKVYSDTGLLLYARSLSGTTTGILLPTIAYTYMENASYTWTITAIDTAGNQTTAPEEVFIIDKDPPAIMSIYTVPGLPLYNSGYDQNIEVFGDANSYPVRVVFKLYDASGAVVSQTDEFVYYASGSGIFPFSGSTLPDGIYSLCADVRDISYNFTQGCVGNIIRDELPPTTTVEYSTTTATTGDVIVTLTGFNKTGIIITNNSGSAIYTFTGNGTFTFEFIDERGRTGSMIATVDWIDKIAPEIILLTPASGTTIVTGTLFSRSGSDNVMISGYIFKVYSDTGLLLYARSLSGTTTGILLPTIAYTYMENASYTWTITAIDTAGNQTTAPEQVIIVDKDPPALTTITTDPPFPIYNTGFNQEITFYGESDEYPVWLTLSLYDASGTVLGTTGELAFYESGSLLSTFPGGILSDGVYTYCGTARDASYNLSGRCLGDVIVDTVIPIYTGIVSGASYQQYPVVDFSDMYLSGATLSGITNSYYSGSVQTGGIADLPEGEYILTIYDLAGNYIGIPFIIDRTKPTVSVMYIPAFGEITGSMVSAILTGISEPIIILNNDGSGTYIFETNGNFTFEFVDLAGNTGDLKVQVRWIKPFLGTITGAELSTTYDSLYQYIGGYDTGTESLVTVAISNSTGILYKNGIALSGMTATGMRDDEFHIRLISSADPLTSVISTMTIESEFGIVTGDFVVITKDIPYTIHAPTTFDFGQREASDVTQIIEKVFSGVDDYFIINDRRGGDTGFYTTIDISDMTSESGDVISNTHIAIKTWTGVTLAGSDNPRINYFIPTTDYQYFGGLPLTFIKRDDGPNNGLTGTYGVLTSWKIDIPALQNVGEYTGVITYTLYE